MAKSSSKNEVFDNSLCSKDCKKNNDSLNSKIKDLTNELFEANNYIYHYKLVVDQLEGRLVEYKEREVKYIKKIRTLEMYKESNLKCIKTLDKELETLKQENDVVDGKLVRLLKSSKDLESLIESQRSDKIKDGVGYNVALPPAVDLYLSPKKDLSWTGLPEFVDDTVTDYSRPSPTVASTSAGGQNKNPSTSEDVASPNTPKPFVKKRVKRGTTGSQNNAYMRPPHRLVGHRPHGAPIRPPYIPDGHRPHSPPMKPMRPNMNGARPNRTTFNKQAHSYTNRSFQRTSAVRPQYRAPWVPTVNRNFPPVNRKLPTGFSYEIKIASGQLLEINKVIKGCKLEIEGHVFDINFISFRSGSFDVIIGMDWLSNHKAKIICHEKVVRIPLPNDKVLRVIGERPEEKMRHLRSAKTKEQKQEEIMVVRDYPKVFLDDLSGLPPKQRECISNLMGKLCDAHVLALPDRLEDFMIYYDASGLGLGCVLMQRGKVIEYASRQLKIHEKNYTTYDLELGAVVFSFKIWKHSLYGTKSVIYTDHKSLQHIFSQKELSMRQRRWIELYSDYDCEIRYLSGKANEAYDESSGLKKGLDEMIEHRSDGALYYLDRIWVPLKGDVRTLIMDEAYKSKYSVRPGADKMYYDLRDRYWSLGMKKDITVYVRIAMDFVRKLLRTSSGHDLIWVIMDRLTKSAHFLPMLEDYMMDRLARLYLNDNVARHGVPISIISDRDSQFTLRFWQSMQEALGTRLDMSTAYHPQTDGQSERTIQTLEDVLRACALYGRKCRSPIMWTKFGEGQLIGPELVQETIKKISKIKDRLKAVRDHQKSYVDKRRKPLEFSVGNHVLLKVSPCKGVVHFGKKGKLELDLLDLLRSLRRKIQVDAKLNFVEEPVEILEKEFKKLKRSRIDIVKSMTVVKVKPYNIYANLGRDQVKPVSQKITVLDHSKTEMIGILKDVLCQVGVTTIIAKFLILDILLTETFR
nr:putative reverse transcriptase domain-containing protein [Tanacetum cinerariifolium]